MVGGAAHHRRCQLDRPGAADATVAHERAPGAESTAWRAAASTIVRRPPRALQPTASARGRVRAGDLAVIPSMVPHGIASVGEETLKVVGFFCDSHIVSTFVEPLQPMGESSLTMGAPVAA